MKRLLLFVFLILCCHSLSAQQWVDVIYLKNGSIIKGTIIEQIPSQSYKIQTASGNVFVYKAEEVLKIAKEQTANSPTNSSNRQDNGIKNDTSSLRVYGKDVMNEFGTVFTRSQMEQILGYEQADKLYSNINFYHLGTSIGGGCLALSALPITLGILMKKNTLIYLGAGLFVASLTVFSFGLAANGKAERILDDYRTSVYSFGITPVLSPMGTADTNAMGAALCFNLTF